MTNRFADNEFEPYLNAWRERLRQQRVLQQQAVNQALADARRIASTLVSEFGAREVWLFGSLARALRDPAAFHEHSDIDLAVDHIEDGRYFTALATALGLASRTVQIVELASCRPELAEAVRREGVRMDGPEGTDPPLPG